MNTWNKVFLGMIFVAAIAIVILVAPEIKIRREGLKRTNQLKKDIATATEKIAKINLGADPKKPTSEKSLDDMSMPELRGLQRARYDERGRAWFNCIAPQDAQNARHFPADAMTIDKQPPPPQVNVQVIITGPADAQGIETDAPEPKALLGVVYVFAEPKPAPPAEEEGGQEANNTKAPAIFLGRFRVAPIPLATTKFQDKAGEEKNGYRVTLITSDPINDTEVDRIVTAANLRWAIYTAPPVDRVADFFSLLSESDREEFLKMFPEEQRELLKMSTWDEPTPEELEGIDSKAADMWVRLRKGWDNPEAESAQNYAMALNWLFRKRVRLEREIATARTNITIFETAVQQKAAENEQLRKDGDLEKKRVNAMDTQRETVKLLLDEYIAEINKMTLQHEKLQALSEAYVSAITDAMLKVTEKIENRAIAGDRSQDAGIR